MLYNAENKAQIAFYELIFCSLAAAGTYFFEKSYLFIFFQYGKLRGIYPCDNDFIVCPRKGYYTEDMWPWDIDGIGLSIVSGNISKNIIYFATDETDAIHIRMGLHGGKRSVKKRVDDLDISSYKQLMRNVLRSYQSATSNVVRHSTMLCLPEPKKEVVLTTEVVIV